MCVCVNGNLMQSFFFYSIPDRSIDSVYEEKKENRTNEQATINTSSEKRVNVSSLFDWHEQEQREEMIIFSLSLSLSFFLAYAPTRL